MTGIPRPPTNIPSLYAKCIKSSKKVKYLSPGFSVGIRYTTGYGDLNVKGTMKKVNVIENPKKNSLGFLEREPLNLSTTAFASSSGNSMMYLIITAYIEAIIYLNLCIFTKKGKWMEYPQLPDDKVRYSDWIIKECTPLLIYFSSCISTTLLSKIVSQVPRFPNIPDWDVPSAHFSVSCRVFVNSSSIIRLPAI